MNRHLDDETLSALLDGAADDADRGHLRSCDRCATRLHQLQAVARAIAVAPPPPTPPRRDAMVHTALTAESPGAVDRRPSHRSVATAPPEAGRRSGALRPWMLAAAAVVVLGVAVPVVSSQLGTGSGDRLAAGDTESQEPAAGAGGSVEGAPEPPIVGGHLGELDLRSLAENAPALDELAGGLADDQRAAPPPSAARSFGDGAAAAELDTVPGTACERAVRTRHPDLTRLAYVATATVEGDPVVLLGFEAAGGEGTRRAPDRVVVVAADSCAELAAFTPGPS